MTLYTAKQDTGGKGDSLSRKRLREMVEKRRAEQRKDPLKHISGMILGELQDQTPEPQPRDTEAEVRAVRKIFKNRSHGSGEALAQFMVQSGLTLDQMNRLTPHEIDLWDQHHKRSKAKSYDKHALEIARMQAEAAGKGGSTVDTVAALLFNDQRRDSRDPTQLDAETIQNIFDPDSAA